MSKKVVEMRNKLVSLIMLISICNVTYSHKYIIDNNLDKVNNKNVTIEKNIIKPKPSPVIFEENSHHSKLVEKGYKASSKHREPYKLINNRLDLHLKNVDKIDDINGFANMSHGADTGESTGAIGLNLQYRDTYSVYSNREQSYYEFSGGNTSNGVLIFKSLGNDNTYLNRYGTYPFIDDAIFDINRLSTELQKAYRSDRIHVTTDVNSDPFYLRATTIAVSASELFSKTGRWANSISTPYIMGHATNIADKYPNLSLHQIKQIILTTATPDDTSNGYLSNYTGWGIFNSEKAMKGPAQFNAGLLDEEAMFAGMPDKIYDNKGNTYFYVDVPENENYEFSNNITSGLTGDSYKGAKNKKSYNIKIRSDIYNHDIVKQIGYKLTDRQSKFSLPKFEQKHFNDDIDYTGRIHKVEVHSMGTRNQSLTTIHPVDVLPSEYRMYKDRGQAGLRKAGKGVLTLYGKQLYDAHTQVLEGTLVLCNSKTNSTYEVVEGATLVLSEDNTHIKHLKLAGDLKIFGNNITIDTIEKTSTGAIYFMENDITLNVKNLIGLNVKSYNLESKNISLNVKNLINKEVNFEDIKINPKKTFKRELSLNIEESGLKLKDLKGLDKYVLLQYDDKRDCFEEIPLIIDRELEDLYYNYIVPNIDVKQWINAEIYHPILKRKLVKYLTYDEILL